ncbi:MAG: GTP-binding protein [Casimicrobiaceae bacterium]
MSRRVERIPATLLAGFQGGATPRCSRALRDPGFGDAAVPINELGAVGIAHRLARSASETRVLENGCVCCTLRDDLPAALADLYWDRLHRRVPRFERVIIETTWLSDPGAVLPMPREAREGVGCPAANARASRPDVCA